MKSSNLGKTQSPKTKNKPSHLSQGPINPNHKIYVQNTQRINDVLCKKISQRRIDVRVREMYTEAGIASPTFYLHCRNINDALRKYESSLERSLYKSLPTHAKRQIVYVFLTNFIARNRTYFLATAVGGDHHMLNKILTKYRVNLVGSGISDQVFQNYRGVVISSINYWIETEGITPETTRAYSERLSKIRPVRFW